MNPKQEEQIARLLGDNRAELEQIKGLLRSDLDLTCRRLTSDPSRDFRYRQVDESRVKELPRVVSALSKAGLGPEDVWEVDDLVGARVVVMTGADASVLAGEIVKDARAPLEEMKVVRVQNRSGYAATHIKGWYPARVARIGCEIQIRTSLEDAWAALVREYIYDREDEVDEFVVAMAGNIAKQIQALDEVFDLIRDKARSAQPIHPTAEPARADPTSPEPPQGLLGPAAHPNDEKDEAEDFILSSGLSEERREAFLSSFLEDRAKTATTERLFNRSGAFQRVYDSKGGLAAGFVVLLRKGPFVEGSSWLAYRTWEFAVAAERFLLGKLDDLLRASAVHSGRMATRDWPALLGEVDKLRFEYEGPERATSVIIVSGPLDIDLLSQGYRHLIPEWELQEELRTIMILGAHRQIPVLHLPESETSALYVADLARFATLTKYGPDAEFSIEEFDELRARELLEKNPNLVRVSEGVEDTPEERLRQLRLHVGMRLFESYELVLKDPEAARASAIES